MLFVKVSVWLVILNNSSKTYSVIKPKQKFNIVIENKNYGKVKYCI